MLSSKAFKVGSGALQYELVEGWEQLPAGYRHADVAGVCTDSRGNVYLLFTKVASTPQNELTGPQTSVWHFGWNTPDSRKYDENFRKMGLTIAQMWDAADGKLVDMSSDTLPGFPTQEQILELRARVLTGQFPSGRSHDRFTPVRCRHCSMNRENDWVAAAPSRSFERGRDR